MNNDSWVEIACDVPAELADVLSPFLAALTGNGVCLENLSVDAFSVSEIPDSPRMTLKAYLSDDADQASKMAELKQFLRDLSDGRPDMHIPPPTVKTIQTEEWSSNWKSHFKPLRIGKRLIILPSWEEVAPSPEQLLLRIDPGMAFGTGGHETTRLCLELLEKSINLIEAEPPSLLDLGTGSGILAMAAALLGAGRILALDIDPEAVEVALENLALNRLEDRIECGTTPLESVTECFDIIMANILAEELVRLAPPLAARLNPGGILILSGILAEKEELVFNGFAQVSLQFVETRRAGDWVAMLYKRSPEP